MENLKTKNEFYTQEHKKTNMEIKQEYDFEESIGNNNDQKVDVDECESRNNFLINRPVTLKADHGSLYESHEIKEEMVFSPTQFIKPSLSPQIISQNVEPVTNTVGKSRTRVIVVSPHTLPLKSSQQLPASPTPTLMPAIPYTFTPRGPLHMMGNAVICQNINGNLMAYNLPSTSVIVSPSASMTLSSSTLLGGEVVKDELPSLAPAVKRPRQSSHEDYPISEFTVDSGSEIDDSEDDENIDEPNNDNFNDYENLSRKRLDAKRRNLINVRDKAVLANKQEYVNTYMVVEEGKDEQEVGGAKKQGYRYEAIRTGAQIQENRDNKTRTSTVSPNNVFRWSGNASTFSSLPETYLEKPGPNFTSPNPVDIFVKMWDESIMILIAKQTNIYASKKKCPEWQDTSPDELYRVFAILIYMSICPTTSMYDFWTTGEMSKFHSIMSRRSFLLIYNFLHFVNNACLDPNTTSYARKIAKISPILEHCNKKFFKMYTPSPHLNVDESFYFWKGRIKSYDLCESESGYLLRCLLYANVESSMQPGAIDELTNATEKVVKLMDGYLDKGYILVVDNWYNQIPMMRYLKSRHTDVIGTINRQQLHVPNTIKQLNSPEMMPGQIVSRHCGDISVVAWKDVKLITVVSTYHSNETVARRCAGKSATQKPLAIEEYQRNIGGVHIKDQKLSSFLFDRNRSKKLYMKVFEKLLNTSLLNAFIIYIKNPRCQILTHRSFRLEVAEGLLQRFPRSQVPRVLIQSVPDELRLDGSNHFPIHSGIARNKKILCARCEITKKCTYVNVQCRRCLVGLCIGQCWLEYHTLKKL